MAVEIGNSYNIAKKLQIKIFGFDTCPNMRSNSLEKGMVVWKKENLQQQPEFSIDAVISSYVFHFLIDDTNLKLLYKILKTNGIIVANFHKNKNRDFIDKTLKIIGFKMIQSPIIESKEGHGTYVIYRK